MLESLFYESSRLKTCDFIKKRLQSIYRTPLETFSDASNMIDFVHALSSHLVKTRRTKSKVLDIGLDVLFNG